MEIEGGNEIVVVKLGGSLLTLPDLRARFAEWLSPWSGLRLVLVVGGGSIVQRIREFDQLHELGEEASHWLAVRALSVTAHLVCSILPGVVVVDDGKACQAAWSQNILPVFDPFRMLWAECGAPAELRHSWAVTSDSIAAWLAARLAASELVLLKSAAAPQGASLADLVRSGLVDPSFPEAVGSIPRLTLVDCRTVPATYFRLSR